VCGKAGRACSRPAKARPSLTALIVLLPLCSPLVLLDPADEKLLEEEIQAPTSSKRSQQHAKVVPWMRKTEYISTEFNRYGISNEKPEVKIGVSVKQQFTEEEIYKDRDSQITAIEKTFEDAQKSISQHYSKPRVTPVEVMPVFPDFKVRSRAGGSKG